MLINFLSLGAGRQLAALEKVYQALFSPSLLLTKNNNNKKNSMPGHMQKVELINLTSDTQ